MKRGSGHDSFVGRFMVGWQAQQSGKGIGKANALIVRMAGLGLNMIMWRTVHTLPSRRKIHLSRA